jgi:CoA:oxalate CoA-transferase
VLTTYLNDGGQALVRSTVHNAHAYLGAPYGIYETADGYIALAMGSVVSLGELLDCSELLAFSDSKEWFDKRDEIKKILVSHLKQKTTNEWLNRLEPADYWCAAVMSCNQLLRHDGFQILDMVQEVKRLEGAAMRTTRCPIRINGERLKSPKWAPKVGEDNEELDREFSLGL